MKRKQTLGNQNVVGHRVTAIRKKKGMKQCELLAKLQTAGIDINPAALSKLEGQVRFCKDYELSALAEILGVTTDWLLGREATGK